MCTKMEEICEVIKKYYQKMFTKITLEMNEDLMKPFTASEAMEAIKQMHLAKAPRPPFSVKNFGPFVRTMFFMMC